MTEKQKEVFDCIVEHYFAVGGKPSNRLIAQKLGVSTSAIKDRIELLKRKDYLTNGGLFSIKGFKLAMEMKINDEFKKNIRNNK